VANIILSVAAIVTYGEIASCWNTPYAIDMTNDIVGQILGRTMRYAACITCVLILPSTVLAGPTSTQRKSQFEKALSVIMASATPGLSALLREGLIRDYVEAKPNKGQAVQLVDGKYFRSVLHEDQTVAGDRTLESCQLRYAKPCALLAVNDEIAAEGELISKDMTRLHYTGVFDVSQIPIIRLVTRTRAVVQNYYAAAAPKAIAIHPWGKIFISTGDANLNDAQTAALAKCNADPERRYKDGPCFVYAVNNEVVLPERRIIPK
jgi:hypothetical protein